jgi:hypothetical protein
MDRRTFDECTPLMVGFVTALVGSIKVLARGKTGEQVRHQFYPEAKRAIWPPPVGASYPLGMEYQPQFAGGWRWVFVKRITNRELRRLACSVSTACARSLVKVGAGPFVQLLRERVQVKHFLLEKHMNQVATVKASGTNNLTSVEIAELTGKRHDNVVTDIKKMLDQLGADLLSFQETYTDQQGRTYFCFSLPPREVKILITGYDVVRRAKVIPSKNEGRNAGRIEKRNL